VVGQYRFSRSNRICLARHFKHVFGKGRRLENQFVRVYYARAFRENSSFAFVAGKKVGNAVCRNRCKRWMRDIVRLHQGEMSSGHDFIFVAKKPLLSESYDRVTQELLKLLTLRSLVVTI